ncbi:MAG: DNA-binding protein [Thermoprotei archaeon]|nr:MAG: DNA-binding protein [Thermoprotei archaeon]RLE72414.1 MAG: DNA-binding protein [Thermoprotei archaeon]
MKIAELKPGMTRINVEGKVVEKSQPIEVVTRRGIARVATVLLEDDSGKIILSLWEENIDMVSVGDRIRVENGYVSSFRGRTQLNLGFYGKLTIVEKANK